MALQSCSCPSNHTVGNEQEGKLAQHVHGHPAQEGESQELQLAYSFLSVLARQMPYCDHSSSTDAISTET